MENREDCMAAEQEKIETDLRLVGGTAVEDKLQARHCDSSSKP